MPVFEITTPTGTFEVEAPDEQQALDALQASGEMGDAPAPQSAPAGNGVTGNDIADSGLTGLRQGVESLGGMFGDAAQMQGDAAGWIAGKFGASPETQSTVSQWGRRLFPMPGAPTTSEIQSLTKPVVGEHYQPQSTAGEYARTVGQFAPGAAVGPGGLMRKTAMTLAPALASETAGQMTKGTKAEPYARAAGALAGGVAAAGRPRQPLPQAAASAADDLGAQSQALYSKADQAGITIKPQTFDRVRKNAQVVAGRVNTDLRPNTAGILKDIDQLFGKGRRNITLEEFDELRQNVNLSMKRAQPQDVRTLERVKQVLDNFADNAAPGDITGDIEGFKYIKEARTLWARKKKVELIDEIMDLADVKTGRYTQSKLANTIREKMDGLYTQIVKGKSKGWTKEEIALIRQMAKGGSNSQMVNWLAKFSPRGVISAAAGPAIGGGLTAVLGPLAAPLMAGIPAAGFVAGRAADRGAVAASEALRTAAATGVAPKLGPGPVNLDALMRVLLTAQSGQNSAIANSSVRERNR